MAARSRSVRSARRRSAPSAAARSPSRCGKSQARAESQPRQGLLHPRRDGLRLLGHRAQGARGERRLDRRALRLRIRRACSRSGFASNFEFVPAYRKGRCAVRGVAGPTGASRRRRSGSTSSDGCLPASSCGDVAHDFGAANVVKLGGKTLQDTVGGRGIQFNGPRDSTYKAIGYPQAAPFNGERMFALPVRPTGRGPRSGQPAADADHLRHDRRLQRRRLDRRAARSPRSSPTATRTSRTPLRALPGPLGPEPLQPGQERVALRPSLPRSSWSARRRPPRRRPRAARRARASMPAGQLVDVLDRVVVGRAGRS